MNPPPRRPTNNGHGRQAQPSQRQAPPPSRAARPAQSPPPGTKQRIKLTPREERLYKLKRREEKRRAWNNFKFYAATSLVLYMVLMLICATVILIKINSFPSTEAKVYDVFFADTEQNEFSATLSGKLYKKNELEINGILYLPTDTLSRYTSIAEGGDGAVRTVYIKDGHASFDIGTSNAVINGENVTMSAPSLIVDSRLCIPMDFYVGYVDGIKVEFDTQKMRYLVTNTADICFRLTKDEGSESISYDSYLQLIHNQQSKK
ncbi:MAG: hypothetical protein E7646_08675 [Ruminococcaceae bacterium]|nr:hypothetical protein [Oscillospiraceae bacterium]